MLAVSRESLPRVSEVSIDVRVLGFTLAIALLTSLLFGLTPALQASNPDLNETLKESSRGSTGGRSRQRIRGLLLISEIVVTTVLLIIAGGREQMRRFARDIMPAFAGASATADAAE